MTFNILSHNGNRCSCATAGKITWRPERIAPELFPECREILFANQAAGNSFEAVHQGRNGYFRWVDNHEMHMVVSTIKFDKFSLKIRTDIGEYSTKVTKYRLGKNAAPIFCDKDQMNMHSENTMFYQFVLRVEFRVEFR